jgi:tRNA (guanine37-N1)-methyltransferase
VTFTILTLFPELFAEFVRSSILARSIERGLVNIRVVNIRDFAADRHRICDDYAYGGGPGMVMKPEPLAAAIEGTGALGKRIVYLTPAGRPYTQRTARELARQGEVVLLCGRYEGIDQRIIDAFVTDELSIGDYVLSGGEVAAMVVVDSVSRLVEGAITGESLEEESFSLGIDTGTGRGPSASALSATRGGWRQAGLGMDAGAGLLEYPHYTRPEVFRGMRVPEVLLSGHHERIRKWRLEKSVEKTLRFRPELLASEDLPREVKDIRHALSREGDGDGFGKSG